MKTQDFTKTLVVDFDDTLAMTHNRNWKDAVPNKALIDKLNDLYHEGWTINIVTARGNISCKTREDADKKYRPQIEKWLKDHDVDYTDLSFEKKLAVYYIDDKGITPEDFVDKFEREELKGGWSGSEIYLDKVTNDVYKTAKNTPTAIEWYEKAQEYGIAIPEIKSVIGSTIRMERLYDFNYEHIDNAINLCKSFSQLPPIYPKCVEYSYADRCCNRLKDLEGFDCSYVHHIITDQMIFTKSSFSHGDYSISNIMSDKTRMKPVLIDPINDPTLFSSWEIDMGKLYMTARLNGRFAVKLIIERSSGLSLKTLHTHEIGHLCRIFPYAGDQTNQVLETLYKRISQFKENYA